MEIMVLMLGWQFWLSLYMTWSFYLQMQLPVKFYLLFLDVNQWGKDLLWIHQLLIITSQDFIFCESEFEIMFTKYKNVADSTWSTF